MKQLPRATRHHVTGATLVELVVSIVVISIGLAGILIVMDRNTRASGDPMVQHQAIAIAEAYLEEILLKDFCDPDNAVSCQPGNAPGSANCNVCPPAELNRADFDNVCDYNNRTDDGARDQMNQPHGLDAYRVRTDVFTDDTLNGLAGASCEVLRVGVSVTGPGNIAYTLSGYRTNDDEP